MARNNGVFPRSDAFIERLQECGSRTMGLAD
jgi:hypothetical protein